MNRLISVIVIAVAGAIIMANATMVPPRLVQGLGGLPGAVAGLTWCVLAMLAGIFWTFESARIWADAARQDAKAKAAKAAKAKAAKAKAKAYMLWAGGLTAGLNDEQRQALAALGRWVQDWDRATESGLGLTGQFPYREMAMRAFNALSDAQYAGVIPFSRETTGARWVCSNTLDDVPMTPSGR